MRCYINHALEEAESHWLLKEKPDTVEGKAAEGKPVYLAGRAA